MKTILTTILLILTFTAESVFAEKNSRWIKIDRFQMAAGGSNVAIIEHSGWTFPSCPNARHAFLDKASENFDEMYATVLMAYQTRDGVIIHGNCHPTNPDYLYVTAIFIQTKLDD